MSAVDASARILHLAARRGLLTREEVARAGIHTHALSRMVRAGALERVGRGRYRLPDAPVTKDHGLALVAAASPKAVICLLSALSFHEIGTQLPHQVWIALGRGTRRPPLDYPPLRVVRFSGQALSAGTASHRIEGEQVRIYNPAKTIADLFKYRHKIGLELVLEALREGWRTRRFNMDEIQRYARICRVERVMQPYLEALVG